MHSYRESCIGDSKKNEPSTTVKLLLMVKKKKKTRKQLGADQNTWPNQTIDCKLEKLERRKGIPTKVMSFTSVTTASAGSRQL